jgi:hypothetical protein
MSQSSSFEEVLLIFNIPGHYSSASLRRFFSDFVEAEKFVCFHYKRRPESKLPNFNRGKALNDEEKASPSTSDFDKVLFNCCPVKMSKKSSPGINVITLLFLVTDALG